MRKTLIITIAMALVAIQGVNAQSIREGMNHLYTDRFQSAITVFQKLLAVNPNNIEAIYWLGQTYLDMDDNDAARQLYHNALIASANSPLLLVGEGHVLLLDNKLSEARQSFETAIANSKGKKGDDPVILNAIGRANIDAKKGDLVYAIEKLEAAAQKDPKNADIFLNLGNAYRKATPGEGGGKAYTNYTKALEINPNFVYAYIRLAKLFETQQNWDLVLNHLNKAVTIDTNFSLAYYELFYYYWFKEQDNNKAEEMLNKYIATRPNEDKTDHDYLQSQLCFSKKDYDCAIEKAESVARSMGTKIKPKVFRQLAYSYFGKKDYENAKKNIDEFFKRTKEAPYTLDYQLKADILTGMGASDQEIYNVFIEGAAVDTVLQSKIDFLNKGADYFKAKGNKLKEADMRMVIYNTRTKPNPGIFVNIGVLYLQAGELIKADSLFAAYNAVFPDSIYGYDWRGRVNFMMDTTMTMEPYITNLLQNYQKTLDIATIDKIKFRAQGVRAALTLAGYYNNIKSDRSTAISFIQKGLKFDSTNVYLKKSLGDLQKNDQQNQPPKKNNSASSKPTGKSKTPVKTAAIKS